MRHVAQDEPFGCGCACIAMLAGLTYQEARAAFHRTYPEARRGRAFAAEGVTYVEVDAALADLGFAVARLWKGFRENERADWPPPPSAGAHLAEVVLPSGGHFIVVLGDGSVLDPARGPAPQRLSDYPPPTHVAAVVPVRAVALAA